MADGLNKKMDLAGRLVNGLSGENKRWGDNVVTLSKEAVMLIGNVMMASSFVSYIGPFDFRQREKLQKKTWVKYITDRNVPMSEGIDPMDILSSEAMKSMWANEGLPADRISGENAAIISNCARWPLIIDPQIQGSKWLKQKYDEMLEIINFGKDRWLNTLINCIKKGGILMIEKVGNDLEPAVDPVLSRAIFTKGGVRYIKIGGDDIE